MLPRVTVYKWDLNSCLRTLDWRLLASQPYSLALHLPPSFVLLDSKLSVSFNLLLGHLAPCLESFSRDSCWVRPISASPMSLSSMCSTIGTLKHGLAPGTRHFHQNLVFLTPGFSGVSEMRTHLRWRGSWDAHASGKTWHISEMPASIHDIMRPNCPLASPLVTIIPVFGEPS